MKLTTATTTLLLLSRHDSEARSIIRGSKTKHRDLMDIAAAAAEPSSSSGKGGKGSGKKLSSEDGCKDDSVETLCSIWQVFDNTVRFHQSSGSGRDLSGLDWTSMCDEFDAVDDLLCPSPEIVEKICQHANPDRNPAVNATYCQPLLEDMKDGAMKEKCILHCVSYVSKIRGDCCNFECHGADGNEEGV